MRLSIDKFIFESSTHSQHHSQHFGCCEWVLGSDIQKARQKVPPARVVFDHRVGAKPLPIMAGRHACHFYRASASLRTLFVRLGSPSPPSAAGNTLFKASLKLTPFVSASPLLPQRFALDVHLTLALLDCPFALRMA